MSKQWLFIDCSYLCHRAMHTTGQLSHNDVLTGVIYGFLRDVLHFQEMFDTKHIAFCFDRAPYLRKADYPLYKSSRETKEYTPEEEKAYKELRRQLKALRTTHLPGVGYRNVFSQEGYEADDIIGHLCQTLPGDDTAIIIGSDKDLYQCLGPRVSLFKPGGKSLKPYTYQHFCQEWGIEPTMWVDVKAMAGCNSDCIEGIDGIGEKTAAKFLAGKLLATNRSGKPNKKYEAIIKGNKIWKRNKLLVRLPYPGLEPLTLRKDKVTEQAWTRLAEDMGFKSLATQNTTTLKSGRKLTKATKRAGGFGF